MGDKEKKKQTRRNTAGEKQNGTGKPKAAGRNTERRKKKSIEWIKWLWIVIPAAVTVALQLAARRTDWFGTWYTRNVFPFFVSTVGRVMSVFPFSVAELGLYGLIVWLVVMTVLAVWRGIRRKRKAGILLLAWIRRVLTAAALLLMIYTMTCGINYYAVSFSAMEGFEIRKSTKEELVELCLFLTEQINEAAENISYENGGMYLTADVQSEAVRAMEAAAETYSSLAGYYPRPKPVMFSWILSVQQLCGVYSPFTVEANYNREMTDYNIPSTACHELSHLKGFAREDEANFIAYLACQASDNPEFRYSGAMLAYIHSTNALYKTGDYETYSQVRSLLCDTAQRDLAANNAFWDQYEGKVAEVSNQVNHTYLQINNQSDGVQSYGRMVDLLLAMMRSKS